MNSHPERLCPGDDERVDHVNENLCLIQKKHGLTFGTDAFLLAAYVRRAPRAIAAELGGGTGIVSLLLAQKNKLARIHVIELQPAFSELIGRNAALNGLEERVSAVCADVRDLRSDRLGKEVDLVFSNPPYMKCTTGKPNESEEKYIARHETAGGISDFCACAARLLRHGGSFVCVWRPDRLSDLMEALRAAHLEPKRMTFVHADADAEPCMLLVEAKKGGAPSVRISPPLILYQKETDENGTRRLTDAAEKIYRDCDFSGFFPAK